MFQSMKQKLLASVQSVTEMMCTKTDRGSQSGDGEVTSAGEGGESGGSPATAEEDQQSTNLSVGARPKTRQDKK